VEIVGGRRSSHCTEQSERDAGSVNQLHAG